MPRYKPIDTGMKLLPIDLSVQLLPGTFEHALSHLVDHELDLRVLHERFKNDETGAPAYAPSVLLKVILYAYSRGIVSSRLIDQACKENIVFMALSGDSIPHFTTLASFVRDLRDEIANLFTQVLFLCDAQGLIGREMFAIDGVKLPSNASKAKSGTRADYERQAKKIEAEVNKMLDRHREADEQPQETGLAEKQTKRIERLQKDAAQLRQWLKDNPEDRRGTTGKVIKSNLTDNESAKMATSKGVIQGYTGVAAVDSQCQIIVEAQAPRYRERTGTTDARGRGHARSDRGCLDNYRRCGLPQRGQLRILGSHEHRRAHCRQRHEETRPALHWTGQAQGQARCALGQERTGEDGQIVQAARSTVPVAVYSSTANSQIPIAV